MFQFLKNQSARVFALFFLLYLTACGAAGFPADLVEQDSFSAGSELELEAELQAGEIHSEQIETIGEIDQEDSGEESWSAEEKLANSFSQKTDLSSRAIDLAFSYYQRNKNSFSNKRYITIFDISKHSGEKRLYVFDLVKKSVWSMHVAHGKNSDTNNDGVATAFSNVNQSKQSSLGFKRTAETYYGKHGLSLRMDGLEARNSKVRSRAIVIHGASYVSSDRSVMGRSWGCPAVSYGNYKSLISKIKGGSLFYTFHPSYD